MIGVGIGSRLTASGSTSGARYTVVEAGLTAEVIIGNGDGYTRRVPAVVGRHQSGREALLVYIDQPPWPARWLNAGHRVVTMLRAVETQDGELVDGDIKARIDAAMRAAEAARREFDLADANASIARASRR